MQQDYLFNDISQDLLQTSDIIQDYLSAAITRAPPALQPPLQEIKDYAQSRRERYLHEYLLYQALTYQETAREDLHQIISNVYYGRSRLSP